MSRQAQRRLLAIVLTIAAAIVLAACGGDDDGTEEEGSASQASADAAEVPFRPSPENGVATELPEPEQANLTIGLLNPCGATEICKVIFDAASEQVDELGGEAVELDARVDPDRQVSQFQQLIDREVDAIAITPIAAPELLGPLLQRAGQEGIPVIAMDAQPGKPGPLQGFASEVWQQRDQMVYLAVKAAAEELGEGAKVGFIGFAVPVPLFEFGEARTRFWAKKFGLEIVDTVKSPSDTVDGGQEAAVGLLANNPEIVGVIGYNDEPAIGAALAARAAGRDDLKTFGACCLGSLGRSSIESGRLTASVHWDAEDQGRQAVIAAYNAAQGVELPPEVLTGELSIVTEENLDDIEG